MTCKYWDIAVQMAVDVTLQFKEASAALAIKLKFLFSQNLFLFQPMSLKNV